MYGSSEERDSLPEQDGSPDGARVAMTPEESRAGQELVNKPKGLFLGLKLLKHPDQK